MPVPGVARSTMQAYVPRTNQRNQSVMSAGFTSGIARNATIGFRASKRVKSSIGYAGNAGIMESAPIKYKFLMWCERGKYMFKKKSEIAEQIHDKILERLVYNELDQILLDQQKSKLKHGDKGMIVVVQQEAKLKEMITQNENLLRYVEKKITAYKFDETKQEEV
jgi:hypothetical protein